MAHKPHPLHDMLHIPEGETLSDLLSRVYGPGMQIIIGKPNEICASCRKPFNAVRPRCKEVNLHRFGVGLPLIFTLHICRSCRNLHQKGGQARDEVLAAIQAYCEGLKADQ